MEAMKTTRVSHEDDQRVARVVGLDLMMEVDKLVEYASDDLEPTNHTIDSCYTG